MAMETTIRRSRRALLAGTVGGLAALIAQVLRPIAAHAEGETIHIGDKIFTAQTATWLKNTTTDNDVLRAESTRASIGVYGIGTEGPGVLGRGLHIGVQGAVEIGPGVNGTSERSVGVRGSGRLYGHLE